MLLLLPHSLSKCKYKPIRVSQADQKFERVIFQGQVLLADGLQCERKVLAGKLPRPACEFFVFALARRRGVV